MEACEALGDEAVVWTEREERRGARRVTHWSDLRAIGCRAAMTSCRVTPQEPHTR